MSEHIPLDIQSEIMLRLPVKSLHEFRSVSKPWKSLIDSSKFIANYHVYHSQPQNDHHLLVSYFESYEKVVSILDVDSFPQHELPPLTVPTSVYPRMIVEGGLFCFYGMNEVVLCNPSIRKSVFIDVPNVTDFSDYKTVIGFGVCPHTCDPKLVKITYIKYFTEIVNISCIPWQVEVFTLSSGAWRSPLGSNLHRKSIEFQSDRQVVVDKFIYMVAYDNVFVADNILWYNLIMSFDMIHEEFKEVYLPDSLSLSDCTLFICKLRESLVVIEYPCYDLSHDVWIMENGVLNSFTKLYTITTNKPCVITEKVLGFRKSGEPIIDIKVPFCEVELYVYELSSKQINHMGISGHYLSCYVSSYMETLLLLDH